MNENSRVIENWKVLLNQEIVTDGKGRPILEKIFLNLPPAYFPRNGWIIFEDFNLDTQILAYHSSDSKFNQSSSILVTVDGIIIDKKFLRPPDPYNWNWDPFQKVWIHKESRKRVLP